MQRKRNNPIQIYLNDEENYLLKTKMQLSNIKTASSFIRKFIKYGVVYEVDYAHLRNMNAELGRIGQNVNQIARRVNTTGSLYLEDVEELKEMMGQIWHLQKSILSRQPSIKR